jgi:signal transduction histidine kinase
MKISKLYIKIFVSVLLGLIVAEALMFGAFRGIYRHGFRQEIGQIVDAHAVLIRSFVETRLAAGETLQNVTVELAGIVPGDVWALDEHGRPVAASLPQLAPPPLDEFAHEPKTREGVRLDFEDDALLALLPITYRDGRRGELVFEFRKGERHGPGEKTFALALAGVAVAFAFLLYPLSRLLGRPLRELRASVLRIADGDLNHRVRVRSGDEIGELGQAFNQMADRVERMVDGTRELTAHVSHELRSPLARIRVATELLRESAESAEAGTRSDRGGKFADLYESINEEIEDLDRLIGRILELSRLDLKSPGPAVPRATSDVLNQLSELARRYRPAFERRDLEFRVRLPGQSSGDFVRPGEETVGEPGADEFKRSARGTSVAIGPEDLQTVVSALLDNAVKYAHHQVGMSVRLGSKGDVGDSLEIALFNDLAKQTGGETGAIQDVPLVDRERIFEPFQRGASHQDQSGAGLGLSIARKVVENAGGSIQAGGGETKIEFVFRLPLIRTATSA